MKLKTMAEQIGGRCAHFTGMGSDKASCAVGVVYATVKSQEVKGFAGIPCFREGAGVPCEKRHFPTPEEVAAEVAECDASWERLKLGIGAVFRAPCAKQANFTTAWPVTTGTCTGDARRRTVWRGCSEAVNRGRHKE